MSTLEELFELLERQAPPSAVQGCLAQRHRALDQVWDEVCTHRELLGEEFARAHPDLLLQLDGARDEYADALEQLAPERLRAAAAEFSRQLQSFDQTRLHWGPSPFPLINLLGNVHPGDPLVRDAAEHFRRALQELLASGLAEQPGWGLKRAALESVCQALAAWRGGAEEIERMEATLQSMHRADETVYQQTFLQGPSAMPMVNLVLNVAERVLDGRLPQADLGRALESAGHCLEDLEADFARAPDQPALQAEIPRTRLAFDLIYNALEDLRDQLESWDRAEVVSCLARLRAAAHRLHGCYQVFAEFAEAGQLCACPRCGHSNGAALRLCGACQAQLPRQAPECLPHGFVLEEGSDQEQAAAQAVQVLEACGRFYDGELAAEDFRASIQLARGALESGLEHLARLRILEGDDTRAAQEFLEEQRPRLQHDLLEWSQGLDLLEQHSHDRDFESLQQGIALIWHSSQAVLRRMSQDFPEL